jgi:hypothetical protein
MKDKLIEAGVRNLREFGYPHCTKDNITTDLIYKSFFVSMLKDNKGHSKEIDAAIDELIALCVCESGSRKGKKKKVKP